MRLFIGYFIPDEVAKYIHSVEQELSNQNISAKYTHHKNLHLTFKFLGETREDTAAEIGNILSSYKGLDMEFTLDRISWFERGANSILFMELSGDAGPLCKKVEMLNDDLESLDFERDSRKFKAHITIGRKVKLDRIAKEKLKNIPIEPLKFTVDEFSLIESTLTKMGAVYKKSL
ncbi:2'-5' RNA ligase [Peptoclostridium litorale DSM 5388]|uniref:RNA 2',3'-cyclic phosphodiesterase n=1 Tax=Peptoclostridium litorale DSM 5388 TaxID=1121324 RepID=A0A069RGL2_PEPLI|nr:RNA 2',3'-cyclic phosphodiesterase [Peptoclostridium litorale]KDR96126.1 hypothetical protein CLIT_5c01380 [Peptoclostridium litorale DSM 5388]SIO04075.1 2'-5' RNA ligase [Peptoclostridium litorale DSM 5388]